MHRNDYQEPLTRAAEGRAGRRFESFMSPLRTFKDSFSLNFVSPRWNRSIEPQEVTLRLPGTTPAPSRLAPSSQPPSTTKNLFSTIGKTPLFKRLALNTRSNLSTYANLEDQENTPSLTMEMTSSNALIDRSANSSVSKNSIRPTFATTTPSLVRPSPDQSIIYPSVIADDDPTPMPMRKPSAGIWSVELPASEPRTQKLFYWDRQPSTLQAAKSQCQLSPVRKSFAEPPALHTRSARKRVVAPRVSDDVFLPRTPGFSDDWTFLRVNILENMVVTARMFGLLLRMIVATCYLSALVLVNVVFIRPFKSTLGSLDHLCKIVEKRIPHLISTALILIIVKLLVQPSLFPTLFESTFLDVTMPKILSPISSNVQSAWDWIDTQVKFRSLPTQLHVPSQHQHSESQARVDSLINNINQISTEIDHVITRLNKYQARSMKTAASEQGLAELFTILAAETNAYQAQISPSSQL